jgi:hypothetical protein
MTDTRAIAAVILWMVTVTLMAVTLIARGDLCHPSGWTYSSWKVVALSAGAAMFASLHARLIVNVTAAVLVGALVGGGFWLLLLGQWVSACTA